MVEFGSGLYSTLTFLNRSTFPYLQELHSFENDQEWAARVRQSVANDPRHKLTIVQGGMSTAPGQLGFADFDLVFIDDSTSLPERLETIESVGRSCGPQVVIVIHDYEELEYRRAASEHLGFMRSHFIFTALNPNTGVLSNSGKEVQRRLRDTDRRISSYSSITGLEDSNRWSALLHGTPTDGYQAMRGDRKIESAHDTSMGPGGFLELPSALQLATDGESKHDKVRRC